MTQKGRLNCPVQGCIKRGTRSSLAQHARSVHAAIDRAVYERALLRGLAIDSTGRLRLIHKPSLWRRLWQAVRAAKGRVAIWGNFGFYAAITAIIITLYLVNLHKTF